MKNNFRAHSDYALAYKQHITSFHNGTCYKWHTTSIEYNRCEVWLQHCHVTENNRKSMTGHHYGSHCSSLKTSSALPVKL